MPKGRIFNPDTSHDGIWFTHRGISPSWPPHKTTETTTGLMLEEPFLEDTKYPPLPPNRYQLKDSFNFRNQNYFSSHDNRNSLQDHGVYFEDGHENRVLGRGLIAREDRQHATNSNYLHHFPNGENPDETKLGGYYCSNMRLSYTGEQNPGPRLKHTRFPRHYKEGVPGLPKLTTSAASWFKPPDVPYYTPTHVIGSSLKPFLGPNKFKYSYHGPSTCYPSYDLPPKRYDYNKWTVNGPRKVIEIN